MNEPLAAYYTNYHPTMLLSNSNFSGLLNDKMSLITTISVGVSYDLFRSIAALLPFSDSEWAGLMGISSKSLQRYKAEKDFVFKSIQSEKIMEVSEVMLLGHEVLGSATIFNQWIVTPSIALGGHTPFSLMHTSYGKEIVLDELQRIEHGIFA